MSTLRLRAIVQGDFHQGSSIFSSSSRGRQCVANSFIALAYASLKPINKWLRSDVSSILISGDDFYKSIIKKNKKAHPYLQITDIPRLNINYHNVHISHKFVETLSGYMNSEVNTYPMFPLEVALNTVLARTKCCIFIASSYSVAILEFEEVLYIFDPHAQSVEGNIDPEGLSTVFSFSSLSDICKFLVHTCTPSNNVLQFEVNALRLRVVSKRAPCLSVKSPDFSKSVETQKQNCLVSLVDLPFLENSVKKVKRTTATRTNTLIYESDCQERACSSKSLHSLKRKENSDSFQITCCKKNNDKLRSPFHIHNTEENEHKSHDDTYGSRNHSLEECTSMLVAKFKQSVETGPIYVCSCCSQTWFRHSVFTTEKLKKYSLASLCLNGIRSVNDKEWVCSECYNCIKENKIPPCSKVNSLQFPEIPPELNISSLEERLVTPRLLFMQIRQKARGGQQSLKGNIVNVPADVNSTIKKLPRALSNDETILIKLKRDTHMKHWVQFQPVRPAKVLDAASWLISNSTLFKNEGICLNETWIDVPNCSNEIEIDSNRESDNSNTGEEVDVIGQTKSETNKECDSDNFSENEDFDTRPTGNMDTVMHPVDFREFNQILSVAPGEGNTPISLFQDVNSEFLAFPTIYCGQKRPDNSARKVPLRYSTICKWELRNVDRRVAKCTPNLFYKMKRLQIKQIKDKVSLAIRKCKTKGKKISVGDILSPGGIDRIVKLDEGYKILRTLRGSPPYWEQAKKDIYAMIRQLGIPTWFISLSAAETRWANLLKILGRLAYNKEYTDDEVLSFSWEEKCKLIRSDAVTCVRNFDHRSQQFMTVVLNNDPPPIGKISDFFQRIEFQQRGSPHIHMLVWVEGAPVYGVNTDDEVIEFIEKFVSCKNDSTVPDLINYQTHRHARTCRKRGKAICRFNFPVPPMPRTVILTPLDISEISDEIKSNYQKISESLEKMKYGEDISFSEFLVKLGFDFETYTIAIRSIIKSDTIFLKRSPSEIRINNYNPVLLKCWEANMDIQYILDPYACAAYIVNYISKGQRGMSNLLYEACKEARKENSDIKHQVRRVGNVFLNHQEIGAQEAAYIVLQLPLRRSSREVVFINTNKEEDRVVLLKSFSDMENLPKQSLDIESDNVLKRYQRRPKCLEFCCLADFVSWFNYKISKPVKEKQLDNRDYLDETIYEENLDDDVQEVDSESDIFDIENEINSESDVYISARSMNVPDIATGSCFELKNGAQLIKRKKQRVIRCVRFNIQVNREDHFRELLMLFYPWRKEANIMGNSQTYETQYEKVKGIINEKRLHYERSAMDDNIKNKDEQEIYDNIAPSAEYENAIDQVLSDKVSDMFGCFDPGEGFHTSDLGLELDVHRKQYVGPEVVANEMPDTLYRSMVQNLNRKQKEFFYHTLHFVKTKDEPFYNFLSGGGGVGKSVLIQALYQALLKYFLHQIDENPDQIKLLLCAPTGKAAYNINGSTLHSAFCIPVGQGFAFKPLDMQQLSAMQTKLLDLKILFIDEISMVGCKMLNFINLRLQEVKGSSKPFGGVSIIAIGDLFQLKPVLDNWVFNDLSSDYGPIASNLWKDHFSMFELHEIMRQKEDSVFAEILNRFREGRQTSDDMKILQSRVLADDSVSKSLPRLFTTKKEVNSYNHQVFSGVQQNMKTIVSAIDTVTGDLSDEVKTTILNKLPDDSSKTMGLSKHLPLAVDLPTEICINIDVEDGLTNGTPGIIRKLDFRVSGSERCSIVWVEFTDFKIGQKMRRKLGHLYQAGIKKEWTPILEVTKKFMYLHYKPYFILRRQFPVHLAAARTIHKAQGGTFESAVVHFGCRKNDHIHYVGLSRVKNMSNLFISELNENKISISEHVQIEMDRMRRNPLPVCLPSLDEMGNGIKIVFQNVRSLHKHIADVKNDYNLMAADILVVAETRILPDEMDHLYSIDCFSTLLRFDCETCNDIPRSPYGMALYSKKDITNVKKLHAFGSDILMCNIFLENGNCVQAFFFYFRPKSASLKRLKEVFSFVFGKYLDSRNPFIIMGDFNIDLIACKDLEKWVMETFSCSQLVKSFTTDYRTCIDHVYTNTKNFNKFCSGTLESYFSDHKPVFFCFQIEEMI